MRAVITARDAANPNNGLPDEEDDYKTKLLKYLPSETVAFYTGLAGAVEALRTSNPEYYVPSLLVLFLAGLIGTPLLLNRTYGVSWRYKKGQIIVSTVAYVLWVLSIGTFQGFNPVPALVMTLLFGVFAFLAPIFVNPGT
jgi:hypothetical protein